MGDKTWPVNQRTSGHVGDHDPCVQKRAALSLSLSHLLGILFPPFMDINFLLIMIRGFSYYTFERRLILFDPGGGGEGGQICLRRCQFKKNIAIIAKVTWKIKF